MADGMGHAVMQRGDPVRDEIGMLFFVRPSHPSTRQERLQRIVLSGAICSCLHTEWPLSPASRQQPSPPAEGTLCCGCAGGCGQRGSG